MLHPLCLKHVPSRDRRDMSTSGQGKNNEGAARAVRCQPGAYTNNVTLLTEGTKCKGWVICVFG